MMAPLPERVSGLDWLIDYLFGVLRRFGSISAIYNDSDYFMKIDRFDFEVLKFLWRLSQAYSVSESRETGFFSITKVLLSLTRGTI